MKKLVAILMALAALFMLAGCGQKNNGEANLTQTPSEILEKMYEGFGEDELPVLANKELIDEELEYNLGLTELDYKEGMISEPMMGSIAHSVVVIRLNENADVEKVVEDIKANVNPRKWVCVEAEKVIVESKGDVVVLIMSNNDTATKMIENFRKL